MCSYAEHIRCFECALASRDHKESTDDTSTDVALLKIPSNLEISGGFPEYLPSASDLVTTRLNLLTIFLVDEFIQAIVEKNVKQMEKQSKRAIASVTRKLAAVRHAQGGYLISR
jgi:hypothetical protein